MNKALLFWLSDDRRTDHFARFPNLARTNTKTASRPGPKNNQRAMRRITCTSRKNLKSYDNQTIARQKPQAVAKRHGKDGFATTHVGIVKQGKSSCTRLAQCISFSATPAARSSQACHHHTP
jgi:hypothetical protein